MDTYSKLGILAEAARYDAACTSSGVDRGAVSGRVGTTRAAGCCHAFTSDGRCVTLLKVLMSNACSYDCAYCVNRRSASCPRATFAPRELAELTVDFYKRNYIEGLFLSSGVLGTPDETCERMVECLRVLRQDLLFNGYVHAKVIPGTSPELVERLGRLADRLSVNLELPSSSSLTALCPDKDACGITRPMAQIRRGRDEEELRLKEASGHGGGRSRGPSRPLGPCAAAPAAQASPGDAAHGPGSPLALGQEAGAPRLSSRRSRVSPSKRTFAPAGQSTQLIVGASPESDDQILRLSWALYERYDLKRIFFSAYMPMLEDDRLPEPGTPEPLRREHRLYQADWLMRYYDFKPGELTSTDEPWLDLDLDPKLAWALRHIGLFPVEVNEAPLETLLRVPGIGPVGARRIVRARRSGILGFEDLGRLKVVLKRARPFLTCNGATARGLPLDADLIRRKAVEDARESSYNRTRRQAEGQLSLF